jgi:hypothetical protein
LGTQEEEGACPRSRDGLRRSCIAPDLAKLRSPEGERVRSYSDWLVSESDQPKLFVRADPNAIGRALARWIAAL